MRSLSLSLSYAVVKLQIRLNRINPVKLPRHKPNVFQQKNYAVQNYSLFIISKPSMYVNRFIIDFIIFSQIFFGLN